MRMSPHAIETRPTFIYELLAIKIQSLMKLLLIYIRCVSIGFKFYFPLYLGMFF